MFKLFLLVSVLGVLKNVDAETLIDVLREGSRPPDITIEEASGSQTPWTLIQSEQNDVLQLSASPLNIAYESRFNLPTVNAEEPLCLTFGYRVDVQEESFSRLHVDLIQESEADGRQQESILTIGRGSAEKQVTINTVGGWQLQVTGRFVANSNPGDMMQISTIKLETGACPEQLTDAPNNVEQTFTCLDGTIIDRDKKCDFVVDCLSGEDEDNCGYECDFTNGLCDWQTTATGESNWNIDDVNDLGHCVIARRLRRGSVVTLQSPKFKRTAPNCAIEFEYATSRAELSMVLRTGGDRDLEVWTSKLNTMSKGNVTFGLAHLGEISQNFEIVFKGRATLGSKNFVAIKQLKLVNCEKQEFEPHECPPTHFQCNNQRCVERHLLCNGWNDCGDNSDENVANCNFDNYRCAFSESFCWFTNSSPGFRLEPLSSSLINGPTLNYKNDNLGRVAQLSGNHSFQELSAALSTNQILSNCVTFYVMKTSSAMTFLNGEQIELDNRPGKWQQVYKSGLSNHDNLKIKAVLKHADYVAISGFHFGKFCHDDIIDEVTTVEVVEETSTATEVLPTTFMCSDGFVISNDKKCDFVLDCSNGDDEVNCGYECDFSGGSLCGWTTDSNTSRLWAIEVTNRENLPDSLIARPSPNNEWHSLTSPQFRKSRTNCNIGFIYASTRTELTVRVKTAQVEFEIWSSLLDAEGIEGGWNSGNALIGPVPSRFEILFRVRGHYGIQNVAAIGKFRLLNCMEQTYEPRECSDTEFRCENNNCVSSHLICNGKDECGDSSDENPDRCDFENKRCEFSTSVCWFRRYRGEWTLTSPGRFLSIQPTRSLQNDVTRDFALLPGCYGGYHQSCNMTTDVILSNCATFYVIKSQVAKLLINNHEVELNNQPGVWQQVYVGDLLRNSELDIRGIVRDGNYIAISDFHFGEHCLGDVISGVTTEEEVEDTTFGVTDVVTDEQELFTELSTTFLEVNFHCFKSSSHVAQFKVCDGVLDCPRGEDEGSFCQPNYRNCANQGIPCKMRGKLFCLAQNELICDGIRDCDDGVDEDPRMCNEESFCSGYCLGGGECDHHRYKCNCKAGFVGKRCAGRHN